MRENMRNLENQLKEIKKEITKVKSFVREDLPVRKISDEHAEKDVLELFDQLKKEHKKGVNIYDIAVNLNLPFEQVEKIFEKLVKEKKLRGPHE